MLSSLILGQLPQPLPWLLNARKELNFLRFKFILALQKAPFLFYNAMLSPNSWEGISGLERLY